MWMKSLFVGFIAFSILMVPSFLIDVGAMGAGELKMPLSSLLLIEAGAYLPVALICFACQLDEESKKRSRRSRDY